MREILAGMGEGPGSGSGGSETALILFFCSSDYDLGALASEMRRAIGEVEAVGCTSAGEIGPAGYQDRSGTAVSFPWSSFAAVAGRLEGLQQFELGQGRMLVHDLLRRLESIEPSADHSNTFAFLLVDGLSGREEAVTRSLKHALGRIQLFGGSAADGGRFEATHVYHEGRFRPNGAVLTLVSTPLPFSVFKTQQFVALEERLVITEADPGRRLVREINGRPAADEYARAIGVHVGDLDPALFASRPMVVVIDGAEYVRSIRQANDDGSLTFYCAIDEGVVLRVARGVDFVENLEHAFKGVRARIGIPALTIACDCILRNLEITRLGLKGRIADILGRHHTVGFSTYGEQFGAVHVNQTFTGIAIGSARTPSDG